MRARAALLMVQRTPTTRIIVAAAMAMKFCATANVMTTRPSTAIEPPKTDVLR